MVYRHCHSHLTPEKQNQSTTNIPLIPYAPKNRPSRTHTNSILNAFQFFDEWSRIIEGLAKNMRKRGKRNVLIGCCLWWWMGAILLACWGYSLGFALVSVKKKISQDFFLFFVISHAHTPTQADPNTFAFSSDQNSLTTNRCENTKRPNRNNSKTGTEQRYFSSKVHFPFPCSMSMIIFDSLIKNFML